MREGRLLGERIVSHRDNVFHDRRRARVVAFSGGLGAGKTTFIKGVFLGMGITRRITSPTFIVMRALRIPARADTSSVRFQVAYHVDAYRIQDPSELERLGFSELLSNPRAIVLVEWPEHIQRLLPTPLIRVELAYGEAENERVITVHT